MLDVFVGRQAELVYLHERLEEASLGRPRVVFVEGPPGIGKTALLRRFLGNTPKLPVLWAAGEELEVDLAFGLIEQLFRGLDLPSVQHLADLGAERSRLDVLAVGADVVGALAALQHAGPVVVVVDDAQWADPVSLQTLTFALRRLRSERVLTVVATRDTVAERLPEGLHRLLLSGTGARLRLGGLEVVEVRRLGASLGAGRLSSWAAERLHAHTLGSPLHARALLEELPPESLLNGELPLPAPRSFAMLVLGRLARCSPETERLVVAVAVLDGNCILELAARLAGVDRPLVALEEAVAAQLLEERYGLTERLIAFPHPLVHAAVYCDLGPARRSSLHGRAAELIQDERVALRHRIAAAVGTSGALADEVATIARQQAAMGGWSAAADALAAAARLSPDPADRQRRLLEVAEWMLLGGRTADASALEATLRRFEPSALQRYVLGRLALVAASPESAEALLADAWSRCDHLAEPSLAARIACQVASLHLLRGNSASAVSWARRALSSDTGSARAQHATDILVLALGIGGSIADGLALCPPPLAAPGLLETGPLDGLAGRGVLRLWSGDTAGARDDLAATMVAYRHRGNCPVDFLLLALGALADAEYRLGAWDDSLTHSELAIDTAEDAEHRWLLAPLHAVASFVHGRRGNWSQAEAHVGTARAAAQASEDAVSAAYAATACALLAAARGDPAGVVAAVAPMAHLPPGDHADLRLAPGILPWRELYVDALVDLGRCAEAEVQLDSLEALARERGEPVLLATTSRLRGSLATVRGELALAETAYQQGLDHPRALGHPFERALLELGLGRLLRRRGRRAAAAAQLAAARERLSRLGARPYLDRCDREPDGSAAGLAGGRPGGGRLTSQERAVASLVAAGYSNREVAGELVISIKTVEFHLGNVFSKLGVRSRAQLILTLPKTRERT
jgi:DNA-binding CsgD family transcriptional regulator